MRAVSVTLLLTSLSAGFVQAQRPARVDVGIHAGATLLIPSGGGTEYVLGLPGGGTVFGLLPPVYTTIFAGPTLMVEPQVSFVYQSFSGGGGLLNAALQVGYLIRPGTGGSPDVAAHLLSANSFGDGSGTTFAAGASLGYRHVVREVAGLRYEARYQRWFDAELNGVALLVGFGVALRSSGIRRGVHHARGRGAARACGAESHLSLSRSHDAEQRSPSPRRVRFPWRGPGWTPQFRRPCAGRGPRGGVLSIHPQQHAARRPPAAARLHRFDAGAALPGE